MAKRSRIDSLSSTPDTPTEASSRPSTPGATPPPAKINTLDPTFEGSAAAQAVIRCTLPPHREAVPFATYEEYEIHYQQAHVNRCGQCGKNFPTSRFLDLHIEENHDSLVLARRARGEKTVVPPSILSFQADPGLTIEVYACSIAASWRGVIGSVRRLRNDAGT